MAARKINRASAVAVTMALVGMGLVLHAVDDDKDPMPVPKAEAAPAEHVKAAVKTDLATIYRDYVANAVAANAKYLDVPITTLGQVERIGGVPSAALLRLRQPGQPNVKAAARMEASAEKAIMAMKAGDLVALRCKGDMPVNDSIVLRHCTVISE